MSKSTEKAARPRDIFETVLAHLELERAMGQDALPRKKGVRLLFPAKSSLTPFSASASDAGEFLERRAAEIADCALCALSQERTQVVYGVGNPDADIMFIGEAPGRDEDIQGEPFVGPAGQLLTRIIKAMGYERSDVYIANICKCRPPQNRYPHAGEVKACKPFLEEQIEHIRPRVIVCLGKLASNIMLDSDLPMGRMRGRFHERGSTLVMPTYHPAYLLRSPGEKRKVWEDVQKVMALLSENQEEDSAG